MKGTAQQNVRELAGKVISAAIAVHKELGPGFLESAYEKALSIELEYEGIPHEKQKVVPLNYRGKPIGEHRLDLLVDNRLIVELKAVEEIDPIFYSIVRSYMKALNIQDALLLNFSTMPLTIKRVGAQREITPDNPIPDFLSS